MSVDWLRSFTRDVHSLPPVATAATDVRKHTRRCRHQLRV